LVALATTLFGSHEIYVTFAFQYIPKTLYFSMKKVQNNRKCFGRKNIFERESLQLRKRCERISETL